MTVEVRVRKDEDLESLGAILVRVYAADGYPVEGVKDPTAWLRPSRELNSWTATIDNKPIGQVTAMSASPEDDAAVMWQKRVTSDLSGLIILARLFVDPGYRKVGAGKFLIAAALRFANSRDCSIAFDVMEKDHAAIRLYESLGAQKLGSVTHVYGDGHAEPAIAYAYRGPQEA